MTSTKLIIALALLLSATSASLAKSRAIYNYSSGFSGVHYGGGYSAARSGYDPSADTQR